MRTFLYITAVWSITLLKPNPDHPSASRLADYCAAAVYTISLQINTAMTTNVKRI
jgi:hypothetical protein